MSTKMKTAEVQTDIEESEERKDSPKITSLVNDAINFLAPYFEVNLDAIREANLPKVYFSNHAHYNSNKIYLPEWIASQNSIILGHEVGHWFHNLINPELFRVPPAESITGTPPQKQFLFKFLIESVAIYSEIIYSNKKDPIQNPRVSLLELTKMDLDEADLKYKDLRRFFFEDLIFLGVIK